MKIDESLLLNQRAESNSLLSTDLFRRYALGVLADQLRWHNFLRVAELRRSCGVESPPVRVEINLPYRYRT